MDSAARITVGPDSLAALARTFAAAAPDPAALRTALATGSAALAGLASAEALAEVGRAWAGRADALQERWRSLAEGVSRARADYAAVDAELAS